MGGNGVSDVSAGAGEGSSVMAEARIDNVLAEVGRFLEGDRGCLVRRSWVDGFEESIWKPSLRIRLRLYSYTIKVDCAV